MRHATITLTMDTYTYSVRGALGSPPAKLPDLSRSDRQEVRATCMDDAACRFSTPGEKLVDVLVETGFRMTPLR